MSEPTAPGASPDVDPPQDAIAVDIDPASPQAGLQQAAWKIANQESGFWWMSDSLVLLHPDATLEPGEAEGSDDLYSWALQLLVEIHERVLRLTRGEDLGTQPSVPPAPPQP